MHFDTLNFTFLCLAALFLSISIYRYHAFTHPPTLPKNPIGFQP